MAYSQSLNILISTLGSHGDIHPFLGIAKALRDRGHHATLIAPAMFAPLVQSLGFDFAPVGTIEEFERFAGDPNLWHPVKGVQVVAAGVSALLEPYYQAVVDRHVPGQTVLVNSTLVFGGCIAQEKLGIPAVSIHLSPAVFRSVVSPPKMPMVPLAAWEPLWLRRLIYLALDRLILDPPLATPINRFRATLGLPPVKELFANWMNSPDRVIGLFPDWYCPIAGDWPPQTVLTGFPLYDEADVTPMDPQLLEFLDGPPPIAFTPGSAMRHGSEFFAAAVAACRVLGRRGLLLSRHPDHIPRDLPREVRHQPYAPFSQVLPRCAAIVHHGGIGTSAQSLAAGIPQLVMPMSHDQPDNAMRLKGLGVAEILPAGKFNARRAFVALDRLLKSPQISTACAATKQLLQRNDALSQTADWIERAWIPAH